MNIIFVDNVPATHDIWVAGNGEGVMAKLYPIMQQMKPSQGRRGIYLHEVYDMLPAISQKNSLTRNSLVRIINSITKLINESKRMPKHILLLLDKSMVELADINVDDIIVKWFLTEL